VIRVTETVTSHSDRATRLLTPARTTFATLIGIVVLQALIYYPQLPARLASHFDAGGQPNGWSSKFVYFAVQGLVVLLLALCFGALPRWVERAPNGLVNLPNKDYWLAPERRTTTLGQIASALTWFGCVALVLVIAITSLVIDFNLNRDRVLPTASIWALLGSVGVCTVALILRLLYLGRRPPS